MSGGREWTTGEKRLLLELRAQRVPMKVIAYRLNRTLHSLNSFLRYVPAAPGRPREWRHVPRINAWSDDEVFKLHTMIAEGATAKEIAEELGRPDYQIRSKATRDGLRFGRTGKYSPYKLEREGYRFRRNAVEGSARLLEAIRRVA